MIAEAGKWPAAPQASYLAESFDGSSAYRCALQIPDRYSFFARSSPSAYAIARGSGLSYVPASFGRASVSIDMSSFNRILAFCDKSGIVEVEAGIRLEDLHAFLIRRKFYLAVQPGYGRITVGGCIAADVHGKNQSRDGTFGNQVLGLRLFHPNQGILNLTPECEPDLFEATCGGYGTTGIVVSARLRCAKASSNTVQSQSFHVANVQEGISKLRSLSTSHDFVYSWHDFSVMGSNFGQGYVVAGKILTTSDDSAPRADRSRSFRRWPVGVFNKLSVKSINSAHAATRTFRTTESSLHRALFPIHGAESYFNAFGKGGFHEYQALVPHSRFNDYVEGLRIAIRKHSIPITLASAKLFAGKSTFLRFAGDGVCFAINFARNRKSFGFLESLDRLLLEAGGRPNLIKDSRLTQAMTESSYPDLPRLRSLLQAWDRDRIFRSELTERIGL